MKQKIIDNFYSDHKSQWLWKSTINYSFISTDLENKFMDKISVTSPVKNFFQMQPTQHGKVNSSLIIWTFWINFWKITKKEFSCKWAHIQSEVPFQKELGEKENLGFFSLFSPFPWRRKSKIGHIVIDQFLLSTINRKIQRKYSVVQVRA